MACIETRYCCCRQDGGVHEKELRELHANGVHGETELPDEAELHDENGQRGEPSLHSVWGSVIFRAL